MATLAVVAESDGTEEMMVRMMVVTKKGRREVEGHEEGDDGNASQITMSKERYERITENMCKTETRRKKESTCEECEKEG